MQTRCPNCQTLYRIDEDVLKRAGGQARCFRCDTVFDAYQHPPSGEATASDHATPAEVEAAQQLSSADLAHDEPFDSPRDLDLDNVPDLTVSAAAAAEADKTLPFEVPNDLPDIEPAAEHAVDARRTLGEHRGPGLAHTLLPGLLGLLLIAVALGQLGWFNRTQVLATPIGHKLASAVCAIAACEVPARRAPSRYAVLDRNIGPDPDRDGVLVMQLGFSNNADFAQPLPDIQLSLYDSQEKLMARRRLHPDEYLFPAPLPDTLVAPGESVSVDVRLEDPGRHATGFKLEFL